MLHVVGLDVGVTCDRGKRLSGPVKRDRSPGAHPQLDRRFVTGCADDANDVGAQRLARVDTGNVGGGSPQVICAYHWADLQYRMCVVDDVEQRDFVSFGRVADRHSNEESIELRLGKWEGPFILDRVLGSQHQEGVGKCSGDAVKADLSLLHRFEQRRLRPGRRPIDLVRQQNPGEYRSRAKLERGRRGVETR